MSEEISGRENPTNQENQPEEKNQSLRLREGDKIAILNVLLYHLKARGGDPERLLSLLNPEGASLAEALTDVLVNPV